MRTPLYEFSFPCNVFGMRYILSFSLSFFDTLWVCDILSLGMHLFFLTCLVGMWHTFFGYASFISFFCIAHILYGHFKEKESWYVMEFYYVGG